MKKVFCWQKGLVTAESLKDRNPYILRFHETEQIPGPVRASCIIADSQEGDFNAEVEIWQGHVLTSDPETLRQFCKEHHYPGAYWWRSKEGMEAYQVWLYQNFPY